MIYLELKKIFDNSKIWLVMLTIFIMSIFLLQMELNFSSDPRLSHPYLYQEVVREVDDASSELDIYTQYAAMKKMEFDGISLEEYDQELVDEYNKITSLKGDNYINDKLKVLYFITNEAYHLDYEDYNSGVITALEGENSNDEFIIRMQTYYKNLSLIKVDRSDSLLLDAIYSQKTFNIGVILMLVILVSLLFNVDNKSGTYPIIQLSKTGENKVLFYKYLAGLIFSIFFFILLFITNIIVLNFRFGFENLSTPIQAFYSYFSSPFMLNIFTYLMIISVSGIVFLILIYSLLWLITHFTNSSSVGSVTVVTVFFISMILSIIIPMESSLISLKYFNLYAFGMFSQSLSTYLSFTVSGVSNLLPILTIIILLFLTISSILLLIISSKMKLSLNVSPFRFKKGFKNFYERTSLFFHEHLKLLFMEYNWIILLLISISMFSFIYTTANASRSSYSKDLGLYIKEHGGVINDELINHYDKEREKFDQFEITYQEEMNKVIAGELSREDFDHKFPNFELMKWQSHIFKGADTKLSQSLKYQLDTTGIDILVSQYSFANDYLIAFIVIIGSIGLFSNAFAIDKRNQEVDIYCLSKSGVSGLYRSKFKVLVHVVIAIALFILMYNIIIFRKYSISLYDVTFFDIANDKVLPKILLDNEFIMNMKLSNYLILLNSIRLVGVYFVLISIFTIGKYLKNRSTVFILSLFAFVITSFLFLSGFYTFNIINVFDLISGNIYFWTHSTLFKVVIISLFNILLTFLVLYKGTK